VKASHRTFVGGAFGALAAAGVAASGAYACHSIWQVQFSVAGDQVPRGTLVRAEGTGFNEGQTMRVHIGNRQDPGPVVATGVAKLELDPSTGKDRPVARAEVTIPASTALGDYIVYVLPNEATTFDGAGKRTFTITKAPGEPAGDGGDQVVGGGGDQVVGGGGDQVVGGGGDQVVGGGGEQLVGGGGRVDEAAGDDKAGLPGGGSRTDRDRAAPPAPEAGVPGSPAVPAPTPAPAAGASATGPGGPDGSGAAAVRLPAPIPSSRSGAPAAGDLWTAMEAEASPSLLDAGAPASERSSTPVGAILLGFGGVALVGVALAAGRRRLAVVRRR